MHTSPEYASRGDAQVAGLVRHNRFAAVISIDHGAPGISRRGRPWKSRAPAEFSVPESDTSGKPSLKSGGSHIPRSPPCSIA